MRLVHIITSLEQGGAQAVLYDLVCELKKKQYEQSIIYMHDGSYRNRFWKAGIPLYHIKGFLFPFDLLALSRLYTCVKRLKPDRMHTVLWGANWMGRIVAKRLGIPCIAALHNNYDQNGWLRNLLDKCVTFSNCALVAVSDEVKQSFKVHQKAHCPILVIRNGIQRESDMENKNISRAAIGLSDAHFVIGSVGRFHAVKRYPLLLESFACLHLHYPQTRLLVIGTGPDQNKVRAYARALAIDNAVGWMINMPALPYYSMMDCFMLTSHKEGISIALLEAMSQARACLVTYAFSKHPVIEHMETGLIAQTSDPLEIAKHIEHLMHNEMLRVQLGNNAQKLVQKEFDIDTMVAQYNQLFKVQY